MKRLFPILSFFVLISCVNDKDVINPDTLDKWTRFTTSSGLSSNDITKLYQDSQGNVWVGSANGTMVYTEDGFETFSDPDAPTGRINAITEDGDGYIFVGTSNGLGIYDDGIWSFFDLLGGSPFGVSALYTTQNGDVWMGTEQGEIGRFSDLSLSILPYTAFVFNFFEESSGYILLGTLGGLVVSDGSNFLPIDGLPNDAFVLSFDEDDFGTVWVGTYDGEFINVLQFSGSSFSASGVSLYNSNDVNGIVAIEVLRNGDVWLGALGAGILMYDGAVMRTNFDADGPGPEAQVQSILQTTNGDIWVATADNGLFKYIPNK